MPKALHDKLEREYRKKGLKGKRLEHAVYGTLTNIEKGKQGKQGKKAKPKKKRKKK
jgi:hypothetical protein